MALYGKVVTKLVKEGIVSAPREKRIGAAWIAEKGEATPYFDKSYGFQLIKDQIKQYIETGKGERVMLPDFGTNLRHFVFEPFTHSLASLLAGEIKQGMAIYIPNISINYIRFFQNDNIKGFGMPGIQVQMSVSPVKSSDVIDIKVNI